LSDITPTTTDRALDGLRERERALETEAACIAARLAEVRDMIALLTSRHSRGRPRVRAVEPQPEAVRRLLGEGVTGRTILEGNGNPQPEPPEAA
jgi:hypothetical protein